MTGAPPTLAEALAAARETRFLKIGQNVTHETPEVFKSAFGNKTAVIVADANTFAAAGQTVSDAFKATGVLTREPFIFKSPKLYAEFSFVEELEASLKTHDAIAVAVGSGTINDLAKLASHRVGRQYMSVGTAASMDGYSAFGASITYQGSKQTFLCPAPLAIVADLDVIRQAPGLMNSWGYADLIAKITAGADWILADALGVEAMDDNAWAIAQGRLLEKVSDAAGVPARQPAAIERLVEGLMLGGFAMQAARSSRAASGAEHQFSHLWDMQHHTYNGRAPSHGFKVGIGTLAVTALYERLLQKSLDEVDIEKQCAAWPTPEQWEARVRSLFGETEVTAVALKEIAAKAGDATSLRQQLNQLRATWPDLRERLRKQLLPFTTLKEMLQSAGAPTEAEEIGISRERLRASFWQAFYLRRRFTILDVAVRTGLLDECVAEIFGPAGPWPLSK